MLDAKTLMLVAALMVRQHEDATVVREHTVARLFAGLVKEFWPLLAEHDQKALHALKHAGHLPQHLERAVA